jgi:hypothetical protein
MYGKVCGAYEPPPITGRTRRYVRTRRERRGKRGEFEKVRRGYKSTPISPRFEFGEVGVDGGGADTCGEHVCEGMTSRSQTRRERGVWR